MQYVIFILLQGNKLQEIRGAEKFLDQPRCFKKKGLGHILRNELD